MEKKTPSIRQICSANICLTVHQILSDEPFDPYKDNPFTTICESWQNELAIPSVVNVDEGILNIASDFKFPHYEICSEELDHITNGSPDARKNP